MPFREKLRKTFGGHKKTGSGESTPTPQSPPQRSDIEYYKPHEIPKPKYRGRIDKEHQDKLEAFSMADAFSTIRKKSSFLSGTFSPGGTKAQSRRASWISRSKSYSSTATNSDADRKSLRRKSLAASGAPTQDTVAENEDDDTDVVNAGLSRTKTECGSKSTSIANPDLNVPPLNLEMTITDGKPSPNDTPFTTEQLEAAMARATLTAHVDSTPDNRIAAT